MIFTMSSMSINGHLEIFIQSFTLKLDIMYQKTHFRFPINYIKGDHKQFGTGNCVIVLCTFPIDKNYRKLLPLDLIIKPGISLELFI